MGSLPEDLRGRDIIIISPQYWGGMWVSKHWIASELSRHNRVLFVEPPVWLAGLVKDPSSIALGLPRLVHRLRRVNERLFTFAPLLWPKRFTPSAETSILAQIRRQVERLGFRDCIAINFTTNPTFAHNLHDRTAIHYCVDPSLPGPGEEDYEALTCRRSDLVFAISESYRQSLSIHDPGKLIHVIPHGIDFDSASLVREEGAVTPPPELAKLGHPLLGFVGSIHDTYVDIDLLEYISRERPGYQIALIGPYKNNPVGANLSKGNLTRIRRLKNVHLLGYRPHHEVSRYIKFFDACLVLIEIGRFDKQFQTRKRTLFKLLHYLSQGKPIIIPDLYEVGAVEDLLYIARDRKEYVSHLDKALSEPSTLAGRRIEYASHSSYNRILKRIVTPIIEFEASMHLHKTTPIRRS
jgi:hypothetical protein